MARNNRSGGPDIWPGFVDALSALFIIVLFVSMVFMAGQFFLSDALLGRDRTINRLQARIDRLARDLGLEKARADAQRKSIAKITQDLQASIRAGQLAEKNLQAARGALAREKAARAAAETQRLQIITDLKTTQQALADAKARQAAVQKTADQRAADLKKAQAAVKKLEDDRTRIVGELENIKKAAELLRKRKGRLDQAMRQLEKTRKDKKKLEQEKLIIVGELKTAKLQAAGFEKKATALEKERSLVILKLKGAEEKLVAETNLKNKSLAEIIVLNRQIAALRQQLASLQALLKASEKNIATRDIQIKNLTGRLNKALASRVQELERYRSEFFGRLRQVLGTRKDIKIVGDRFIFQSEVLFDSGSAELTEAGKARLKELAGTLKQIMAKIPARINWVLRVDGHTDKRPFLRNERGNWGLSTDRAVSVVKFLIGEGIPARRMVAAGFGEQYPIAKGDTDQALARNRRIEFKITQR